MEGNWKKLTIGFILSSSITLAVFGAFNFTLAQSADEPNQAVISDINQQIDAQRKRIDELTQQIEDYKKTVQNTRKEAITLKNQVSILDNQIAKANIDIKLREEEIGILKLEIERTNIEIKKNESSVGIQKDRLADVIRLLNRYESRDYISILLGNESFSTFFDQMKYSEDLQQEMQKTLNKIKENITKLNTQQKELDKKKEELSKVLNKLEDEKEILGDQKNEKKLLVTETQQSEKRFQSMIANLKKEQSAANNQVAGLEKKLRAELAKKGQKEKFNSLGSASLDWPTSSHRITSTFHDPTYPYRYLFEHSGLDLGVKTGNTVRAAEAGYVAKVALGTKWYGNYVMVIHSNNLSTLYAHLSSVSVSADQYVAQGQQLGLSGSTGFSSGPHLHFEVRSNGIPVDPIGYLP